jgi:hypothetical protein
MVVYTALTGGYDDLRDPVKREWRHVCFADGEIPSESGWEFSAEEHEEDHCRHARRLKILSHFLFDDDLTVWVDAALSVDRMLTPEFVEGLLGDADMAVYRHNKRDCAYAEAQACVRFKKDDPEVIGAQMGRYEEEGFPRRHGLAATGVLLRRNTQAVRDFCEMWWGEVENGSRRDQLSFDYCRWRTGLKVACIPGSIYASRMVTCYYHHGGVIR